MRGPPRGAVLHGTVRRGHGRVRGARREPARGVGGLAHVADEETGKVRSAAASPSARPAWHGGLDDLAMRKNYYSYFVWGIFGGHWEAAILIDAVTLKVATANVSACALPASSWES